MSWFISRDGIELPVMALGRIVCNWNSQFDPVCVYVYIMLMFTHSYLVLIYWSCGHWRLSQKHSRP